LESPSVSVTAFQWVSGWESASQWVLAAPSVTLSPLELQLASALESALASMSGTPRAIT
jgi:hypothetical protein